VVGNLKASLYGCSPRGPEILLQARILAFNSPLNFDGIFSSGKGGGLVSVSVRVTSEGRHELIGELPRSALYNRDLAPTPISLRTWGLYSYLAFWVGCCVVIPSWSLANVGLVFGFTWWASVLVIIAGNAIVTIPLLLNSHVGAKYGIPFPVFARASFGVFGANIATLMRAIVACGWMGIESWLGGYAMYVLLGILIPGFQDPPYKVDWFVLPGWRQLLCFLIFLVIQVWVAIIAPPWKGSRAIKVMFDLSAPFLLAFTTFLFLYMGFTAPGGFGALFNVRLTPDKPLGANLYLFWLLLNINVGFWSTMALNISDVTRFAKNHVSQMIGQAIGLIGTMAYFSTMGILVTMGGTLLFPQTVKDTANQAGTPLDLWNPINLFALLNQKLGAIIILLALIFVILAQLSTNIGANIIAPANDFQNVYPKRLNWTWGVLITAVIGVIMQPWVLFFNAMSYAITWLSGYGGFLGAIGGILIADYWLLRRQRLNLLDLYRVDGVYSYGSNLGINWLAVVALLVGILPPFVGWLHQIQVITIAGYQGSLLDWLQTGSWFYSFAASFVAYLILMGLFGQQYLREQTAEVAPRPTPASGS
jgi:NCS1 family nucleobase:cation symporter-1